MILVTGATGNVGSSIVKKLHDAGQPIRVISRNPSKVTFPNGVEVHSGDLTNADTMRAALNEVKKIFLIRVPDSDWVPQLAKELGVEHIVFLSSSAIESKTDNAIGRMHAQVEEQIKQTGVNWTFLRPGAFMSNSLQWIESIRAEGAVRAPFGHVRSVPIDPRDIASVAVKALCASGHDGKTYRLTGPESLTPQEQVQMIGDVLGKKVEFHNIPEAIAKQYMTQHAPADIVDSLFKLMNEASAELQPVLHTVEEVTGQPPLTFKQWVMDNADAFR